MAHPLLRADLAGEQRPKLRVTPAGASRLGTATDVTRITSTRMRIGPRSELFSNRVQLAPLHELRVAAGAVSGDRGAACAPNGRGHAPAREVTLREGFAKLPVRIRGDVGASPAYSSPVYGAHLGFLFSRKAFGPSSVSGWPA